MGCSTRARVVRDVVVSSARGKLGVSALGGPRSGVAAASRTTRADVGALHSKAPHGHPLVGNSALLGKDDALLLPSRDLACSTCRMPIYAWMRRCWLLGRVGSSAASALLGWVVSLFVCVRVRLL